MYTVKTFEQGLIAIMKTFYPSVSLHFGEEYYRVISGISDLGKKKHSFSTEELIKYITEFPVWRDKPVEAREVRKVLEKLERGGLITKHPKENYKISSSALESLGEFFTLHWRPKGGRTGFMSYLLQSKQRTIQWCCIYLGSKLIDPTKVSKLSGLSFDTCRMFLERLVGRHQLKRIRRHQYIVIQEKEILKDLMSGYQRYQYSKPTIKDTIIEIMLDHDKMSGKEIHEHLKMLGIYCDPSTVYTHLRNLKKQKTIREAGHIERRAIPEKYYALNYEDVESYKKELLKQIRETFDKVGIIVKDEFFVNVVEQKPHTIRVFLRQLWFSIAAQDEHDYSSWQLWMALADGLVEKDFPMRVSKFLLIKSMEEQEKELRSLVKDHNISPALLSMLLLFQHKKAKFDGDR